MEAALLCYYFFPCGSSEVDPAFRLSRVPVGVVRWDRKVLRLVGVWVSISPASPCSAPPNASERICACLRAAANPSGPGAQELQGTGEKAETHLSPAVGHSPNLLLACSWDRDPYLTLCPFTMLSCELGFLSFTLSTIRVHVTITILRLQKWTQVEWRGPQNQLSVLGSGLCHFLGGRP